MNSESTVQPHPPGAAAVSPDERLSAWFDGELDESHDALVVADLLREPAQQRHYAQWCMVGDALRSQEVAAEHSPRLCSRIALALRDEPVVLAPRALPRRLQRQMASAAAIAAAAAVLVFVALPQLRGSAAPAPALAGAATGTQSANGALASSSAPPRGAHHPRLDPYFQAHRDFSGVGVMPAAAIYLRSGNEGDR